MFKNKFGFGLIETMLAIGISTATALVVYKVIGESQKGQVIVENRDEINQLHREIIGKFTDRSICSPTLENVISNGQGPFPLIEILNINGASLLKIPFKRGKISITEMEVSKIEKNKNQAEIVATYNSGVAGKISEFKKTFVVELSFNENKFEGCMARGTLGIDAKDACDLVVGQPLSVDSYFYNGKCNFAKAACEQSGRIWNEDKMKCNFSDDDLLTMRRETCDLFNMKFSEEDKKCLASEEMMNAFSEIKKIMEEKGK